MWKIFSSRADHRWRYGACALYAGYLKLQTHSEYVILTAFLLQQWPQKSYSMLLYTLIACLVGSWDMAPSSYVDMFRRFGVIYCLDVSIYRCSYSELFPWKAGVYRTTWHPFPQDSCFPSHQSENSVTFPSPHPQNCSYAYIYVLLLYTLHYTFHVTVLNPSKYNCIYCLKCQTSCHKKQQRYISFRLDVTTVFKRLISFNLPKFWDFNLNFSFEFGLISRRNLQIRSEAQIDHSSDVKAADTWIWAHTVLNAQFKNALHIVIRTSSHCNRPWGPQRKITAVTLYMGKWSAPRPGCFYPRGKRPGYPLYRTLRGPQGRSPTPGFDPRTVQPLGSLCTPTELFQPTYLYGMNNNKVQA